MGSMQTSRNEGRLALVSLSVFVLCCSAWVLMALYFPQTGWDFTQFYIAGNIAPASLYDQAVFQQFGRSLEPAGIHYYPPYVRPSVFSLPLRLVMWLPYWPAFAAWAAIHFACYVLALYLLHRQFRFPPWLMAGFGLFYPAMFGIITGQDSNASLLLMVVALRLLQSDRQTAAGVALGLAVYKFNLILLLPIFLLVQERYRAFAWFCATAAILFASSLLITPAGSYLALLGSIQKYTIGFEPARMLGLRGTAYALQAPYLYPVFALGLAALCIVAFRYLPLVESFCIMLMGSLLCAYHVGWYDASVLAIPCVVVLSRPGTMCRILAAALLFGPAWMWAPGLPLLILALIVAFLYEQRPARSRMAHSA